MPEVAAVVVNWNGGALAVDSVSSLARQSIRPTIWVVDNASADGSADAIARAVPAVRQIRNMTNRGFAAANNQALRELGDVDYVLLMNNDVVLPDPAGLERVVTMLERDRSIAGACGRYEYPDGSFQGFYNRLPTTFDLAVTWGAGKYIPALRRSRRTQRYLLADADFSREMDVEQPAFACVLLRGGLLRAVGHLDEQFPIFFNDVDYCWRWRAAGHSWRYVPEWRIVHHQSRSTKRLGPVLAAELAGSALRFARKHLAPPARWLVEGSIFAEACWRTVRHREPVSHLPMLVRGELFFRAQ